MNRPLSVSLVSLALLAAVPFLAPLWGLEYYLAFAMRLLVTMLIASSLNQFPRV